ncbi:MAG: CRTAC1 family protein [Proteobacteria bacterium]|nr:CRTAC1 family protein [Pseudomonadota bacterium]
MARPAPILLLLVPLLAACPKEEEPVPGPGFTYGDEIECESPTSGWDRFSEEAATRGLSKSIVNPQEVFGIEIYGRGGGLVAQDMDDDGDLDLVINQVTGSPDFYANDGSGRFTLMDTTVGGAVGRPLGVAAADLDGDDLPELFFASGNNVLMVANLGGFAFADVVRAVPEDFIDPTAAPLSFALGDVDGDEDLDLAISVTGGSGGPGDSDPVPDVLMLNSGDGTFTLGQELYASPEGSVTQVTVITDRDLDGDQDIFIPNDRGPVSAFYRNDGDGTFVNDAHEINAAIDMAAMGADNWDLNGDGDLDYCLSDVGPIRCLISDGAGGYFEGGAALGLYPAEPVAVHPSTVGWAYEMADLNGDGLIDAVQASGPCPGTAGEGTLDIPDLIWAGTADGGFVDVTADTIFGDPAPNYGLAAADFDGDGFQDLVVAGPDAPPTLFMNSCSDGAWVEFDLVGPPANRQGYGARVFVDGGGEVRQRELWTLRGQAQGPARLHFGLGDLDLVDTVTVLWPDGRVSVSESVPTRRRITVDWAESADGGFVPPGDDDDDAADDDDTTPDDGTGPVQAGKGEIVIEGSAFPASGGPGGSQLEWLTVTSSHAPEVFRATNATGTYTMVVPEDAPVTVTITGDGYVPTVTPIDTTWQRTPNSGLFHAIFDDVAYEQFMQNLFGGPAEAGKASIWFQMGAGGTDFLYGTSVEIDADYGAVWAFGGDQPVAGNELVEGASFVGFSNVPAGPLNVTLTTPDGEVCDGRTSFDVVGDSLMQVVFLCP